jgi:hypothetical protein
VVVEMGFWDRTWALVRMTFDVIRKDSEMLLFPLIAGLLSMVFSVAMLFPTVISHLLEGAGASALVWGPAQWAASFGTYLGLAFITTFFNVCVVYTTKVRLSGGDATFGDSVGFAFSRVGRIFVWALLAASVGMFLRALENAARNVKGLGGVALSIVRSMLGAAWTVLTLFVVPAMVYRDLGPIDAIRSSSETLQQTWGESLVRHYGMGFAQFLFMALGVVGFIGVFLTIGAGLPVAVTLALAVLVGAYMLGVLLVFNVANAVFNTALYHYASTRQVPAGYTQEVMSGAFMAG